MKMNMMLIAMFAGLVAVASFGSALNPLEGDDWDLDPDMDGLNNAEEFSAGTDPNLWDTDGDGLPDGWEVDNAMDPTDFHDAEEDNDYFAGEEFATGTQVEIPYTNYDEYYRLAYVDEETGENVYIPTDPNNPDTDGDNIYDPDDSWPWIYDVNDPNYDPGTPVPPKPNPGPPSPEELKDSDKDGLRDSEEYLIGTDPFNRDTDGDLLIDSLELQMGLDPNDWDTDNDMLIDEVERGSGYSTDGHIEDSDNDGI